MLTAAFAWGLRHRRRRPRDLCDRLEHRARRGWPGLNTAAVKWLVFTILGALTGLAAVLNAVRFNQIPSNAGIGLEMKVIAAVVVGGASVAGGTGSVLGTVLGVVLLAAIGPALTFLGVSAYWERGDPGRDHPGGDRGRRASPSGYRRRRGCRSPARGRKRDVVAPADGSRTANGCCCWRWPARSCSSRRSRRTSSRSGNFFEMTRFSVELGLLAVALTPVIVSGGIDLSVGSMMGLAAVTFGAAYHALASAGAAGRRVRDPRRLRRRRAECAAHREAEAAAADRDARDVLAVSRRRRGHDAGRRQLHRVPAEVSVPGPGVPRRRDPRAAAAVRR